MGRAAHRRIRSLAALFMVANGTYAFRTGKGVLSHDTQSLFEIETRILTFSGGV